MLEEDVPCLMGSAGRGSLGPPGLGSQRTRRRRLLRRRFIEYVKSRSADNDAAAHAPGLLVPAAACRTDARLSAAEPGERKADAHAPAPSPVDGYVGLDAKHLEEGRVLRPRDVMVCTKDATPARARGIDERPAASLGSDDGGAGTHGEFAEHLGALESGEGEEEHPEDESIEDSDVARGGDDDDADAGVHDMTIIYDEVAATPGGPSIVAAAAKTGLPPVEAELALKKWCQLGVMRMFFAFA